MPPGRSRSESPEPSSPRRILAAAAIAALLALAADAPIALAKACCPDSERAWRPCEILTSNASFLVARLTADGGLDTIAIGSAQLADAARSLRQPKRALMDYREVEGRDTLNALGVRVGRWRRIAVGMAVAATLLLVTVVVLFGRARRLVIGQDNRYSDSKCQALVWFLVLIVSYLTTVALRWWAGGGAFAGGVDVPEKLLVLAGLSGVTFVGAKAITQGKVDRVEARAIEQPHLAATLSFKPASPRARFPADLFSDDHGRPEFGDFQLIVVTLIAVVLYGVRVFVCLGQLELACQTSLPDVDTTLLGAVGIAQGAYLAKKAAARLGDG